MRGRRRSATLRRFGDMQRHATPGPGWLGTVPARRLRLLLLLLHLLILSHPRSNKVTGQRKKQHAARSRMVSYPSPTPLTPGRPRSLHLHPERET